MGGVRGVYPPMTVKKERRAGPRDQSRYLFSLQCISEWGNCRTSAVRLGACTR